MPLMSWDQSLDIGVQKMNDEHRDILDVMNKIFDAHGRGESGPMINLLVTQLGDVCVKHFADEEKFMQETGFPGIENHKALHKKLLTRYGEFAAQIRDAGGKPSAAFFDFLTFWLRSHIKGIDVKYAVHAGALPESRAL